MHLAKAFIQATYIAFKLCSSSVHAFPGNRTYYLLSDSEQMLIWDQIILLSDSVETAERQKAMYETLTRWVACYTVLSWTMVII